MILSPMRFKNFVWPHNPRVYTITYERKMAEHKIPFGRHYLQSLGQTRRVLKGSGEFVGEGAYDKFSQLATIFYEESPGVLVHPVWVTTTAWFAKLEVRQEPRRDYVSYCFEFWEVFGDENTSLKVWNLSKGDQLDSSPSTDKGDGQAVWYTVVQGDTLWKLANQYGIALDRLVALNPHIKNPNLIFIGQKVRVS